jgi:DNA-binding transcriptional ArsR family regulator
VFDAHRRGVTVLVVVNDDRPHNHAPRRERRRFSDEAFERAATIFHAAGDVARLKLLERLCDGEWCVSELASLAGANMSTVSQQLRLLRAERLVTRRREGSHLYYSLADEHVRTIILAALEHANEPARVASDEPERPRDARRSRSR